MYLHKNMYRSTSVTLLFALLVSVVVVVVLGFTPSLFVSADGWNSKKILYRKFNKATLDEAKRQQKPIMLIIHKTWCPACKQMRRKFEASAEIEALSEYFVMADAEDDDEPTDERYAPNGSYSPRILFVNPENGNLYPITNPAPTDPNSPHFYGSATEVVRGMMAALHHTSGISHVDEL